MSRNARDVSAAHAALTSHVRREARAAHDIDDIVQESWLRVIQAEDRTPVRNLAAYLRRIASNLIRDRHRRSALGIEVELPDDVAIQLASPLPSPEAQLITRSELERMTRVIEAMPKRPREVFRLARVEGLSFAEIGRVLGISRQTVHEHMARALLDIQAAADGERGDAP